MLAVIVALALGVLEWRVVRGNVGAQWNGYGAMAGTLDRSNAAPMRYRVLVPWLWAPFRRWSIERGVLMYQVLKVALLAGALVVAERLLGRAGMLALAVLVAVTFEFDYWDCYAELLGLGLVLWGAQRGAPVAVAVGGVVWGLSRETALLAPAMGLVAGGGWMGLAALTGPAALGLVQLVQGRADLYCERWTMQAYNVPDLALARERADVGPALSVAWMVATVAVVLLGRGVMPAALARTAWSSLAWLAAGWTMARARETRIFLPCALWLAAVAGG